MMGGMREAEKRRSDASRIPSGGGNDLSILESQSLLRRFFYGKEGFCHISEEGLSYFLCGLHSLLLCILIHS